MINHACAAWAVVCEFELPSPEIGASDKDVFVNSLPSEIVVTCSTLEKRLSSKSLRTIFSTCRGVMILRSMKASSLWSSSMRLRRR